MSTTQAIRLIVPGSLLYRDIAVRTVVAACRLVGDRDSQQTGDHSLDLTNEFDGEFVSAFSEMYNNIAIHGYGGEAGGDIAIEIIADTDKITVIVTDSGATFDFGDDPLPELPQLPEGGMGLHIMKAFVDEVHYAPGPPNVWRITKYVKESSDSAKTSSMRAPSEGNA